LSPGRLLVQSLWVRVLRDPEGPCAKTIDAGKPAPGWPDL
jgi:hypothetical protein